MSTTVDFTAHIFDDKGVYVGTGQEKVQLGSMGQAIAFVIDKFQTEFGTAHIRGRQGHVVSLYRRRGETVKVLR